MTVGNIRFFKKICIKMHFSDRHFLVGQFIVLGVFGISSAYTHRSELCYRELKKIEGIKQKDITKYNDYVSCIKKCQSTYSFSKHGTYCKKEMKEFYDSVSETI